MRKVIQILKQMPLSLRATIAFFIAKALSAGVQYLTTPIYTRLLTPDEYGQMSVFLTWVQILGIPAMFCLSYGVFNNAMVDHPEKRDEYSFSMLILSNVITILFSGAFFLLYPWLGRFIGLDPALIAIMCALFFFQPAYNIFIAKERYELQYKKVLIGTALTVIVSPLAAVAGILLSKNRLYGQIFGANGSLIFIYLAFYFLLAKRSGYHVETKYWKAALLFNLPILPHYLSQYLLNHSDRLMIAQLVGDSAAAFYSVAYSVAMVPTIIWAALNETLTPFTYQKCKEGDYSGISRVMLPVLTGFSLLCLLLTLFAPELVAMMATKDYAEAIYVIPPIVGGIFFQVQYNMCANIIYYHKKPGRVMIASVTATGLNLFLNAVFIPRFGYLAAGWTTLFSYIVQAVIDYIAMRHVVKRQVYDLKYVLCLSLLVIFAVFLCTLLYRSTVSRYLLVLGCLLLCFAFRKKLISAIMRLKDARQRNQ